MTASGSIRWVILDDDPTGIQTVYGGLVITRWDEKTLERALCDPTPFFFVLTNSRAKPAEVVQTEIRQVVRNALRINRRIGARLVFVCRSDSTLRGHFPLEIETVAAELARETPVEGLLFVPAFVEGGRVTRNGTHYVLGDDDSQTPVGETEFARDSVFPYSNSYLPNYIEEKTRGRIASASVAAIDAINLETWGSSARQEKGMWTVINAEEYADLNRAAAWVRTRIEDGHTYLIQTSASFTKALTQTADRPLLRYTGSRELPLARTHGLIIVGSHVSTTTEQLAALLRHPLAGGYETNIDKITTNAGAYLDRVLHELESIQAKGATPVVSTPRRERREMETTERLTLGEQISALSPHSSGSSPGVPHGSSPREGSPPTCSWRTDCESRRAGWRDRFFPECRSCSRRSVKGRPFRL